MTRAECSEISRELESWYLRENGRYLLAESRARLQPKLDTAFGYHCAQLSFARGLDLLGSSRINHRLHISECPGENVGLVSAPHELPLASDSVDTLVTHHCLEFSAHPHQALREMQRVLTPQGQLFIVGFNPLSLLGLGARLQRYRRGGLWRHYRPLTEHRLVDWLHLLGCEVQSREHFYTLPPTGGTRLRGLISNADGWCSKHAHPLGGVYLLHAVKQVGGHARVQREPWRRRGRLIGLTVPKPAPTPTPRQGDSAA